MPDDPYSLADLARLADVTTRTIRYYVAQGLLPSPEAAGPATRYGEGHLARLRLIKRLQRDHLPLAEIRGRLERMGDEEVRDHPGRHGQRRPGAVAVRRGHALLRPGADGEVRGVAADPRTGGRDRGCLPASRRAVPIRAIPGAAALQALKPLARASRPPASSWTPRPTAQLDALTDPAAADGAAATGRPGPSPVIAARGSVSPSARTWSCTSAGPWTALPTSESTS